ncbi:hypothetical protein VTL71DRAFT_1065 [Oculimacula yallundae]|uniref:Uncharacterized protein n=1 Tax=Oculimacula yallundae TaxID=86028 RepID=A0ABR4D1S6_9HELO
MKSFTAFSLLAFASSAVSSPLAAPELQDRTFFPNGCSPQEQVLIWAGLNKQFCSAYLQPTSTVTVVRTALNTAFATATTTQTVFTTSTSTPVPSVVCNVAGFAQAGQSTTFFNDAGAFTSAQCQAQCLSIGSATFATSSTLCACYAGQVNDVVAPAPASPNIFSDVNCPVAVSAPVKRAATTCASAASKNPPYFIQKINPGPALISGACECLLNDETPASCVITRQATVTATTTIVQVQTATTTQLVVVTAA